MMRKLWTLVLLFISFNAWSQNSAYQEGEYFKFRVHYGIVTAGFAELSVKSTNYNGREAYHIIGEGRTRGMSRLFFKVEDLYETYIDKETGQPLKFIRDIYEGGYTKNLFMEFDHFNESVLVTDIKRNTEDIFTIEKQTQDLLSSFYHFRNQIDIENLKVDAISEINVFFDNENYKMQLKYLGKERIRTDFGRVVALKFRPYVQSGRVFKEQESLTVWISNDINKLPLLIKADLAVGSLKASLIEAKGLKYDFIKD